MGRRWNTYLDAELECAEKLKLVFGNELGEGDEKADLKAGETVVGKTVPAQSINHEIPQSQRPRMMGLPSPRLTKPPPV